MVLFKGHLIRVYILIHSPQIYQDERGPKFISLESCKCTSNNRSS